VKIIHERRSRCVAFIPLDDTLTTVMYVGVLLQNAATFAALAEVRIVLAGSAFCR
jgi:hypothetical protein